MFLHGVHGDICHEALTNSLALPSTDPGIVCLNFQNDELNKLIFIKTYSPRHLKIATELGLT